jgi:hypothetical protein
MKLQITGTLTSAFKTKPFTDKEGNVTPEKGKLQFRHVVELPDGRGLQEQIETVSCPIDVFERMKGQVGKEVTVPVNTTVYNNKVIYYVAQ